MKQLQLPFLGPTDEPELPLRETFKLLHKGVNICALNMYDDIDKNSSYYYFKECFLIVEQPEAIRFQAIHGFYYAAYNKARLPHGYTQKIISDYFEDVNSLEDIITRETQRPNPGSSKFCAATSGMLERSTALIHYLNKTDGQIEPNQEKTFVELMSCTSDIGEICRVDHLARIANSARDLTLQLVARCLINIGDKRPLAEFELREALQDICITHFDRNLDKLIEHIYHISPAVAEHLVSICNETFLATLFRMMERPVDAMKARASMLNRYGQISADERYIDRAKTLNIDIQINREKGTIDDSRIYVDPLKYSQWVQDSVIGKLSIAIEAYIATNTTRLISDWETPRVKFSPDGAILSELIKCYREFCSNNIFGIASYLGRRIRHGTFAGTATSEVFNLSKKPEYAMLFNDHDFSRAFKAWFDQYDLAVARIRDTSLQIKSKSKPLGVINPEISGKLNQVLHMFDDVVRLYQLQEGVAQLPEVIIEHCWRLVEPDLSHARKLLSQQKSLHGVFSYKVAKLPYSLRQYSNQFCQEVNALTNQKFGLIASWFSKPSYASPTTDIYLLFRAVVSEVKDSVQGFNPSFDVNNKQLLIKGGTYYVIYDALYVLIQNKAVHGKKCGKIHFDVSEAEGRNALRLILKTEQATPASAYSALEKIGHALEQSKDDAHIFEKNSGIPKLKLLEREGGISDIRFSATGNQAELCCEFFFELNIWMKYEDNDS